jgi:poly-beta-1,6-N-acetyl-D-glucosamine synthase
MKYLAITPAYNEERFLPALIECVTQQSISPSLWILIDDGSSDRTSAIIDAAALQYCWIRSVHLAPHSTRRPGGESVVMAQLERFRWREFDYIFRVDADITVDSAHTSVLLQQFERDPLLGIASGTNYEPVNGSWRISPEPSFQAAGNCRIYKRECLAEIGGIESGLGWDTIDITRALMFGFHTRNFREIKIFHHRPMQTANGRGRGRLNMGIAAYNAGYSPVFMAARSLRHAFASPMMMGGALMMLGYLRPWLRRESTLADRELVKFVRRQQLRRLIGRATVWR